MHVYTCVVSFAINKKSSSLARSRYQQHRQKIKGDDWSKPTRSVGSQGTTRIIDLGLPEFALIKLTYT
jgi:hypothetical protein